MKAKMVLNVDNMTQEDLRYFIRVIREWELRTPKSKVVGIQVDTDPEMADKEAEDILRSVFPGHILAEPPQPVGSLLQLGDRALMVDGELLGTVNNLSLVIGQGEAEQLKKLQDARIISLERMNKG